jgi:hypothetical protein
MGTGETLQERMARIKAEQAAKPAAKKRDPISAMPATIAPKDTAAPENGDISYMPASVEQTGFLDAVLSSPAVIREGLRRNAAGVLTKAGLNTAMPNAYQAAREGRNPFPGLGQDIAQLLISPVKSMALLGKLQPVKKIGNLPLIKPINKSLSMPANIGRNIARESATGAIDNLIYEGLSDLQDNRNRNISDYGLSGMLGGLTGGLSGALQAREQAKKMKDYATWLMPLNYKNETKQNIRNSQNNTDSNLETFSKIVNEEHPLTTTAALGKKKKEAVKEIEGEKGKYKNSPEANKSVENATLSDFQKILTENLYNDNSGNLSLSEKDLVMKNFYDDALDMLVSNSPSLKKYMEDNSKKVLGSEKTYLHNKDFMDLAMRHYNLTPNDMNLLRKSFQNKTTLNPGDKTKSGYVRAGEDNRGNNEYYNLFKKEIETRPETKDMNALNKKYSKAKNHEEMVKEVLSKQGMGGITGNYFPFFDLNPEINPTAIGNNALKVRNTANAMISAKQNYSEIPEENREDYQKIFTAIVQDAQKLGIKTEEGMKKYVISRLEGGNIPEMETVGFSEQKRGER